MLRQIQTYLREYALHAFPLGILDAMPKNSKASKKVFVAVALAAIICLAVAIGFAIKTPSSFPKQGSYYIAPDKTSYIVLSNDEMVMEEVIGSDKRTLLYKVERTGSSVKFAEPVVTSDNTDTMLDLIRDEFAKSGEQSRLLYIPPSEYEVKRDRATGNVSLYSKELDHKVTLIPKH